MLTACATASGRKPATNLRQYLFNKQLSTLRAIVLKPTIHSTTKFSDFSRRNDDVNDQALNI